MLIRLLDGSDVNINTLTNTTGGWRRITDAYGNDVLVGNSAIGGIVAVVDAKQPGGEDYTLLKGHYGG